MKKIRDFFCDSFLYLLAIELVEETLEELIAWGITNVLTWVITKALSALIVVALTQSTKIVIKRLIKRITYKEGNDKMNKIKTFFTWIFANKKTLLGIGSSAVAVLSGTGVIDVNALPELLISGFNLTPVLYYAVLALFSILGITGKGFETIKEFFARKEAEKIEKDEKAIVKEAQKEIVAEAKQANLTQAQTEKAEAKEAKAKAEAEAKARAEEEHRARVEEAKAKLKAEAEAKASESTKA